MNATQIADALAEQPPADEIMTLVRACESRRQWIQARCAAISYGNGITTPEERAQAILAGPAAARALDLEIDTLSQEAGYLGHLAGACYTAHEQRLTADARRAIPAARKQLPVAVKKLRTAMSAFDAAIVDLNAVIDNLAQYDRLEDRKIPLSDAELAELLELRNELWQLRQVSVLQPPEQYARSYALFFERRGDGSIIVRRPGPYIPDLMPERANVVSIDGRSRA